MSTKYHSLDGKQRESSWLSKRPLLTLGCALLAIFAVAALFLPSHLDTDFLSHSQLPTCDAPSLRQEWRSLTTDERLNYIRAVQCLAETPSVLLDNGTRYDDFPYLHALKAERKETEHMMPDFLPFHRYILHVYEKTLQEECSYNGTVPYWDWTLDWTDMPASPVFDPTTGFGGDGNPSGEISEDHGRCLIDGPFVHFRPLYRQTEYRPHCLSRGFRKGSKSGKTFPGLDIRPEKINQIMIQPDYDAFTKALEMGPHNIIPFSIRGDFFTFGAPYDPLFFLHHAQLDRLWWLWQQQGRGRVFEYGAKGSLDDTVLMHGLAPDISMREAMSTSSELMCYRYL